ncbi:MAG: 16S rRNA (guanine(527)-N(7))-methyltransferase RsmG [Bacillota bacterium]
MAWGQEWLQDMDNWARAVGVTLSTGALERLAQLGEELVEYNQRVNLTAITGPSAVGIKHFADSLSLIGRNLLPPGRGVDVGTGGGFPGLVLAIAAPDRAIDLVEANQKKVDWLSYIILRLGLEEVRVVRGRAEELGTSAAWRERYAWATARAVAPLAVLAEFCLPLVALGGHLVAMKGPTLEEGELETARPLVGQLGGRIRELVSVDLPEGAGQRTLVVVEKVRPTPSQFPRTMNRIKRLSRGN